jgi:hypothetical protein
MTLLAGFSTGFSGSGWRRNFHTAKPDPARQQRTRMILIGTSAPMRALVSVIRFVTGAKTWVRVIFCVLATRRTLIGSVMVGEGVWLGVGV